VQLYALPVPQYFENTAAMQNQAPAMRSPELRRRTFRGWRRSVGEVERAARARALCRALTALEQSQQEGLDGRA